MEIQGVVHNGVVIPDDASALVEGTRVCITVPPDDRYPTFGERFANFKGAITGLPSDLAQQHDHYRLGTSKR